VKPEALRLADNLFNGTDIDDAWSREQIDLAAAELRRLHEVNQELLEALEDAAEAFEVASEGGGINFHLYAEEARAAIAKAEEKK
jgi:hypothetical protein